MSLHFMDIIKNGDSPTDTEKLMGIEIVACANFPTGIVVMGNTIGNASFKENQVVHRLILEKAMFVTNLK